MKAKNAYQNESIKQIVELLGQGYATLEILRVIRIEWELSESRFYVHLNEAKKKHQYELQEQKKKDLEAIRLTRSKKKQKGLKIEI